MKRVALLLILFMISACGAAPMQNEAPATEAPVSAVEDTATLLVATFTMTPTTVPATPTETQLPPLELPTSMANAPALLAWDGLPTYPGDSKPGYFFRVNYNPDIWALTSDDYGFPAIAHRRI